MKKIAVFLSSAMTGELDTEREVLQIFFNSDPTLKEFYTLYLIEKHASPRKIEKAYTQEVNDTDIYLLLLNIELRAAVQKEYLNAIARNKKIFCYIKADPSKRNKSLQEFIESEIYKYHPAHYLDTKDLCNRIKNDFQTDLIRSYNRTLSETIEQEKVEYIKSAASSAESIYRYFPLDELVKLSKHEKIITLTIDQLIALSSMVIEEQGNYKLGLMLLEIGILRNPENWILHNNRGLILDSMGLSNLAMYSYKLAIQLNPTSDSAYYNFGNSLFKLGKYQNALKYYLKALEIVPEKANAISRIAACYLKLEDSENALKWSKLSYEKLPDEISISNIALALAQNNKPEEAIKYLAKINNSKIRYKNLEAYILKKSGKFSESIAIIDFLYQNGSLEYENFLTKFYCIVELEQEIEAQNWIEEIEKRFPMNPWDYNNIGFALVEKFGKSKYATQLYRKALEIDPSLMVTWQNLQYNLSELGELELGLEACNEALKIQPYDPKSIKNKSLFLQKLNRFDEMIRFIFSKTFGVLGDEIDTQKVNQIMDEAYKNIGFEDKETFESVIKMLSKLK
jgi:superkiller protein 3